jgi:thiol-disulfide isomerase/thioredoxin
MRKYILFIVIMVLATILAVGCSPKEQPCPDYNTKAPNFTAPMPDGKTVQLKDYLGKVVILNFWATWCGPCQAEIPYLQAIYKKYINSGLVVLAVNEGEDAAKVNSFIESTAMALPVILDQQYDIAQQYCLPNSIPLTIFINKEGLIKAAKVGAFQSQSEIENYLSSFK